MNQNWQDKRIRQLFDELREQDARHAPAFASTLEAALARPRPATFGGRVRPIAAAVCLLLVVIGSVFFFIKPFSTRPTIAQEVEPTAPTPNPSEKAAPAPPAPGNQPVPPERSAAVQKKPPKKQPALYGRRQQLPTRNLQPAMLISKWQSPTATLLKAPGAEVFRNIPQVGEPLVDMKKLFPNEKD